MRLVNHLLRSCFVRRFHGSQREAALAQVQRFDCKLPIEGAVTPPSSWFNSRLFHELDKKAIFDREWICVGRVEQVDAKGKYFAANIANEPVIVVNDGDDIKAFFNVCRHHASRLCPDGSEGCTKQ